MPRLQSEHDLSPTPSGKTGKLHVCYETELESRLHQHTPFAYNAGFRCRELFEKKYWQPLINSQVQSTLHTSAGAIVSDSSILPRVFFLADLKKGQIIIGAVVTVRMSSGNTGFPRDPIFKPDDQTTYNRLYEFM